MKSTEDLLDDYRVAVRASAEATQRSRDAQAVADAAFRAAGDAEQAVSRAGTALWTRLRTEAGVDENFSPIHVATVEPQDA